MKLLSLYLFALLAATAILHRSRAQDPPPQPSLTCHKAGTGTTSCASGKCFAQTLESTVGVSTDKVNLQDCGFSCEGLEIQLTFTKKKYLRASTVCCTTNQCNTPPTVPSGELPSSNLVCPGCFAEDSIFCEPTLIKCPESENQCVNITGIFVDGTKLTPFYGRGCATSKTMLVPLFYPISRGGQSSIQITAIKKVKDAEKSLTCRTSSTATQLCTNAECYSQQAESTIDGSKTPHDILTCLSSCKARDIKFTFGDKKYIRANGKCCVTDNCNSIPAVSNTDVKNSSLECPGCFEFKTYCEATLMKCPEKEDQCVNITGTFVDASGSKPFYGRGCTAVTERDIVLGDTIATGENSWFQISGFSVEKAKDSSWSVQESSTVTLLLSGLIGIQLTNFFY